MKHIVNEQQKFDMLDQFTADRLRDSEMYIVRGGTEEGDGGSPSDQQEDGFN